MAEGVLANVLVRGFLFFSVVKGLWTSRQVPWSRVGAWAPTFKRSEFQHLRVGL